MNYGLSIKIFDRLIDDQREEKKASHLIMKHF